MNLALVSRDRPRVHRADVSHGTSARLLPWLLPFLVAVISLLSLDVPLGPIAKYTLYFALAVAMPGILILRGLWRSTGNWAEDFGLGSAVGAVYQLAGWAIFTALGRQGWLVV